MIKESTIALRDGCNIYQWESLVDDAQAHLFFVHGYAEHSRRYDSFAKLLNENKISFTAYDQRGHGRSDGLMAYICRFEELIEDLHEVSKQISSNVPLFLMGHSLGGLVALNHLLQHQENYAGFISASAALEVDPEMSPLLQKLAPIIGFLFPKLPTQPLDTTFLTRSPENFERYYSDPLIYTKGMRARTAAEMIKTIQNARTKFSEISLPIFVLHGESDRLTMPSGSAKLYNEAQSSDKTHRIYPGHYHELVFEPEGESIMKEISDWIMTKAT